jgi:hypothetical protein
MEMALVVKRPGFRGFPTMLRTVPGAPFPFAIQDSTEPNRTETSEPSRIAGQHPECKELDSHPDGRVSTAVGAFPEMRIGENRSEPLSGFNQSPAFTHQMPFSASAITVHMLLLLSYLCLVPRDKATAMKYLFRRSS